MVLKIKFASSLIAVALLTFSSACKEEDPQPAFEYQSQGFVRGNFIATTKDNSFTFNEDFIFTQYSLLFGGGISTYEINDDGTYSLIISRASFANYGAAAISFDLDSSTDTTPSNLTIEFEFTEELSNRYVSFSMDSDVANTSTLTGLKFDVASGRCVGKFTLEGKGNSTEKMASITGEFDVIAKRPVE